jgi:hypothetical protein
MATKQKFYTISTMLFNTRQEAEAQILKFEQLDGGARVGTKIFEVVKAYEVSVPKVVRLKEVDLK